MILGAGRHLSEERVKGNEILLAACLYPLYQSQTRRLRGGDRLFYSQPEELLRLFQGLQDALGMKWLPDQGKDFCCL